MKSVTIAISESAFESQVKSLARLYNWKYYHTWRSFHSPAGYPDCVLVRPPRLIYAELKSEIGKVQPKQQEWLNILAQCPQVEVYLWRPSDFESVVKVLSNDA